jgi:hypothetical protein
MPPIRISTKRRLRFREQRFRNLDIGRPALLLSARFPPPHYKTHTLSHSSSLIESKFFHSLNLVQPYTPLAPTSHPILSPSPLHTTHRISHHQIQPTQLLNRLLHCSFRIRRVRHIGLDNYRLHAQLLACLLHLLRRLDAVEVVDGDVAAFFGEGRGE